MWGASIPPDSPFGYPLQVGNTVVVGHAPSVVFARGLVDASGQSFSMRQSIHADGSAPGASLWATYSAPPMAPEVPVVPGQMTYASDPTAVFGWVRHPSPEALGRAWEADRARSVWRPRVMDNPLVGLLRDASDSLLHIPFLWNPAAREDRTLDMAAEAVEQIMTWGKDSPEAAKAVLGLTDLVAWLNLLRMMPEVELNRMRADPRVAFEVKRAFLASPSRKQLQQSAQLWVARRIEDQSKDVPFSGSQPRLFRRRLAVKGERPGCAPRGRFNISGSPCEGGIPENELPIDSSGEFGQALFAVNDDHPALEGSHRFCLELPRGAFVLAPPTKVPPRPMHFPPHSSERLVLVPPRASSTDLSALSLSPVWGSAYGRSTSWLAGTVEENDSGISSRVRELAQSMNRAGIAIPNGPPSSTSTLRELQSQAVKDVYTLVGRKREVSPSDTRPRPRSKPRPVVTIEAGPVVDPYEDYPKSLTPYSVRWPHVRTRVRVRLQGVQLESVVEAVIPEAIWRYPGILWPPRSPPDLPADAVRAIRGVEPVGEARRRLAAAMFEGLAWADHLPNLLSTGPRVRCLHCARRVMAQSELGNPYAIQALGELPPWLVHEASRRGSKHNQGFPEKDIDSPWSGMVKGYRGGGVEYLIEQSIKAVQLLEDASLPKDNTPSQSDATVSTETSPRQESADPTLVRLRQESIEWATKTQAAIDYWAPNRLQMVHNTPPDEIDAPRIVVPAGSLAAVPASTKREREDDACSSEAKRPKEEVESPSEGAGLPGADAESCRRSKRRGKDRFLPELTEHEETALHRMLAGETGPIKLGTSHVHGRGVFATADMHKGDFVCEYRGVVITGEEAETRDEAYERRLWGSYILVFKDDGEMHAIDAVAERPEYGLARYINHSSKKPNLRLLCAVVGGVPRVAMLAKEEIFEGQELKFDYGDREKATLEHNPWLNL
jgi:hypothetical protein